MSRPEIGRQPISGRDTPNHTHFAVEIIALG